VVGYVGRINEKELKKLPRAEYRGTHHIGKVGIERTYEQQLHGQTGHVEIEANAQGRSIKTVVTDPPKPGADLYLSLDIDLQKTAYDAFGEKNGAAVAIEVKTGKVLAFISRPGFNTNLFVTGISSKAYKELQQSDDQPMFNRALRGQYPPGSTIKPFLGLAALEYNTKTFFKKVHCPGYYQLANNIHKYRDWKVRGHGWVNMRQAITQSCDVYFYDLAFNLGIDRIHDFLQQFGFGEKTEIDLLGEKAGLIPSREWKKRVKQEAWYHGETLITGIGQGFMQVTPLQLARATATLANNGDVVMPYLVEKIIGSNEQKKEERLAGGKINFNIRNYFNIVSSMVNVIHGARGTARKLSKGIDYQIAGKTGTAQVFTVKQEEKYNEAEIEYKLRDHAVFMAFAPVSDPQIAVSVIVEHGGHGGSVAAPIAGKLIHQFLTGRPEVGIEN
jgi:penicillin-binding protein 2